jgi:hypothetical protein
VHHNAGARFDWQGISLAGIGMEYFMAESSTPTGGRSVFLSYAQEDTEAARRIKEALSASGIGVSFEKGGPGNTDPSEEKVRGQIKTCALFIPIISQRAEACAEGVFRRERKWALERTRHLAGSRTFIVPVVIDQTVVPGNSSATGRCI